jgi:hypothetical protein
VVFRTFWHGRHRARPDRLGRLNPSAPRRLFLRGFLSPRDARLKTSGAGEMITLKHLKAAGGGVHIQLTAGLAQTILLILLVVVVAGSVAIWNRSRYRP